MADGKITGRDIIDDSVFTRLDDLLKKLDESIKKFREIEKNGKAAYSPDNINELTEAQKKLAIETDKVLKGERQLIEEVKNQTNEQRALARAKAQAKSAGGDTNRQIQEERATRNEINRGIREEIKLRRQQQTAYGRLKTDVDRLEKEYKELAAAQKLNTTQGKALTAEFQRQKGRLDAINRSAGDFRNNVGNYSSALRPAITAVRQFVGAFGLIEGIRFGVDFAREAAALAREAKGVEFAFQQLGAEGVKAFNDIKESTRGLLSDLDIKTSINEFSNFNIDLEESGVLFEFLAVRAAQTGQSVDKLRDSLVEGLSKESLLRIDNLGISAAELNAELEKTPSFVQAVANIARTEIAEAGDILEETANSSEKLNASIENFKLSAGNAFARIPGLDFLADQFDRISEANQAAQIRLENLGEDLNVFERLIFNLRGEISSLTEEGRKANRQLIEETAQRKAVAQAAQQQLDTYIALNGTLAPLTQNQIEALGVPENLLNPTQLTTLNEINEAIKEKQTLLNTTNIEDERAIRTIQAQIKALEKQRNAILGVGKATNKTLDGPAIIDPVVNAFDEAEREAILLKQAFERTFENTTLIETDASITGLERLAAKAEEVAGRIENSSGSVAEALLDINEETFNLAQGLFGQIEGLTGISSTVFEDLAFGVADLDTAADALNGAFSNVERAQQERLARQLEANQQYLEQIRSDERLSADEKIALEQRVAEEERRIRQEQAQAQKTTALFSIAVDTARAIAKALAGVSFVTALPQIATITAIGAAQAALVAAQPLPQFFKGKVPLDNYEGPATWGEKGQEVLVTPGGEMFVSPNKTTPLWVGKDDIIVPSFSQFDKEMNNKGEVFNRLQTKMTKETRQREDFNYQQFEKSVYKALKRAGVGPVKINLDARRHKY